MQVAIFSVSCDHLLEAVENPALTWGVLLSRLGWCPKVSAAAVPSDSSCEGEPCFAFCKKPWLMGSAWRQPSTGCQWVSGGGFTFRQFAGFWGPCWGALGGTESHRLPFTGSGGIGEPVLLGQALGPSQAVHGHADLRTLWKCPHER